MSFTGCAMDLDDEQLALGESHLECKTGDKPIKQKAPVRLETTWDAIPGTKATLTRYPDADGLEIDIKTKGVNPGDAITLFLGVFDNPAECSNPIINVDCSFPDVGNPLTEASLMWAGTGDIADANGKVRLKTFIERDNMPGEIYVGDGWQNFGAEVHFVIRNKGPAGDDFATQIATYEGGCDENPCEDIQFTLFRALE